MEAFLPDYSFIGWLLLCMLTFGILSLWISLYMSMARAKFYESIKDEVPSVTAT